MTVKPYSIKDNIKENQPIYKVILTLIIIHVSIGIFFLFINSEYNRCPSKELIRTFEFTTIAGTRYIASYKLPENASVYITSNRGSYACEYTYNNNIIGRSGGILEYGVINVKEIK